MTATYDGLTAQEWAMKYGELVRDHNEMLGAIYQRQQREATAWRDEWKTVNPEYGPGHPSESRYKNYARAADDVSRFPYREIQHRRVTDWQTVNPAHHDNT